jgi:hypothetical protein
MLNIVFVSLYIILSLATELTGIISLITFMSFLMQSHSIFFSAYQQNECLSLQWNILPDN